MILGFSHTQLVVRDVAASAAWYCRTLGLEQFVEGTIASGPYVGLRHREAKFVIGLQTATREQAATLASSAIEHLSFAVADRSVLETMRDTLLAHDVAVGPIFEEPVSYNARVTDPDGLVLEFTAPKVPLV